MLVLLFVALWFFLRGDLLYVFPCVIFFLWFSVLLVLRLPRLGKRELILVLFVRLFGLCLFRFVGFLFLLGSGMTVVCDCGNPWTFLLPFLGSRKASLSSHPQSPTPRLFVPDRIKALLSFWYVKYSLVFHLKMFLFFVFFLKKKNIYILGKRVATLLLGKSLPTRFAI